MGEPLERTSIARILRADDDHRVNFGRDLGERRLTIGGGKTQIASPGCPHRRKFRLHCVGDTFPLAVRQGGLSQKRNGLGKRGQRLHLGFGFNE